MLCGTNGILWNTPTFKLDIGNILHNIVNLT